MRRFAVLPVLLALPLTLPLAAANPAAWPGPDTLGIQARLSLPGGNIPDATASRAPGLGASLMAELHFDSVVCARLSMGSDSWRQKGSAGNRSVQAYSLGMEGLCFLNDDGGSSLRGAYVAGGLAVYTWALGSDALGTGTPVRTTKAALTVGLGYRFTAHVDAEVRIIAGKVTPDFTGAATMLGINYRF